MNMCIFRLVLALLVIVGWHSGKPLRGMESAAAEGAEERTCPLCDMSAPENPNKENSLEGFFMCNHGSLIHRNACAGQDPIEKLTCCPVCRAKRCDGKHIKQPYDPIPWREEDAQEIGRPFNWKEEWFMGAACGQLTMLESALRMHSRINVDVRETRGWRNGWTALHIAAFYGWLSVVEFLVHHGADLKTRIGGNRCTNYRGCTALRLAEIKDHHEVYSYIRYQMGYDD